MSSDYFIIIGAGPGRRQPFRHKDWEAARVERDRLRALDPAKHFRIYRCKNTVRSSSMWPAFEAYVREQAKAGDLQARALVAQLEAQRVQQPNAESGPATEAVSR